MKNSSMKFLNGCICGSLMIAIGCLPCALNASEQETTVPAITFMISPVYPANLSMIGISEGSATIMISIDSNGKLIDWIPLSTTRPEFIKAVDHVIELWEFKPATRNGVAVPFALCMTLKFRSEGAMISINNYQMSLHFLMDGRGDAAEIPLIAKYSELDRLPEPVNIVHLVVDSDVPASARTGTVTLGFVIDTEGNVRMPALIECNGDIRLAYAAYNALVKWKFSVPTKHGEPVMTRASQKFIFKSPLAAGK